KLWYAEVAADGWSGDSFPSAILIRTTSSFRLPADLPDPRPLMWRDGRRRLSPPPDRCRTGQVRVIHQETAYFVLAAGSPRRVLADPGRVGVAVRAGGS